MLQTQTYIDRRIKLIESIDSGLLLFLGNDESPMNYADNPFDYRQDSSFLYFFGLDIPGLAAVISGAYALFFQCGTGHMIGLDVPKEINDIEAIRQLVFHPQSKTWPNLPPGR